MHTPKAASNLRRKPKLPWGCLNWTRDSNRQLPVFSKHVRACIQRPVFSMSTCVSLFRCGALASLEGLIRYLGLHTTPADATFCPAHRAQLCYLPHVLNMVLKKSTNTGDHSVAQVKAQCRICIHCMCIHLHECKVNEIMVNFRKM